MGPARHGARTSARCDEIGLPLDKYVLSAKALHSITAFAAPVNKLRRPTPDAGIERAEYDCGGPIGARRLERP